MIGNVPKPIAEIKSTHYREFKPKLVPKPHPRTCGLLFSFGSPKIQVNCAQQLVPIDKTQHQSYLHCTLAGEIQKLPSCSLHLLRAMKKSPRLKGPGTERHTLLSVSGVWSQCYFLLCSLCAEQSTDIPLTFLLHRVSERNGKKKKTGFVLWLPVATCPPIWLGHFFFLIWEV